MNDKWEIAIGNSFDDQLTHFSFVNSIATLHGGTHITTIVNQLSKEISEYINKKHKDILLSPSIIKNNLCILVNCQIENPTFDSQTKEMLTTKSLQKRVEIPDDLVRDLAKNTNVIDNIINYSIYKQKVNSDKKISRKKNLNIPKLDDAALAGGPKWRECTLILTEGDSAKALAIAGLSVVGREKFGVFPLKGKMLNVRDASRSQILNNEEISNLKKILGLQETKTYDKFPEVDELRYGKVMLMCDQDYDGSHIKGLFINMLHTFWPNLLKKGFVQEFITPIIKATNKSQVKSFFTIPEYEKWREEIGTNIKNWKIKYYKGLGTSTAQEAKEYFKQLDKHRIQFIWENRKDSELIEMAFSKDKVSERKNWLSKFKEGTFIDHSK